MASQYPESIDSFTQDFANETESEDVHPEHHNDLADAVLAIETELGANSENIKEYTDSVGDNVLQQAQDYSDGPVTTTTKTGNYTLTVADASTVVQCNSGSTITITVPANVFNTGHMVKVSRVGTGSVVIAAGAGLTLRTPYGSSIGTQYGDADLRFRSSGECIARCDA